MDKKELAKSGKQARLLELYEELPPLERSVLTAYLDPQSAGYCNRARAFATAARETNCKWHKDPALVKLRAINFFRQQWVRDIIANALPDANEIKGMLIRGAERVEEEKNWHEFRLYAVDLAKVSGLLKDTQQAPAVVVNIVQYGDDAQAAAIVSRLSDDE
jgi:hypothetical protein